MMTEAKLTVRARFFLESPKETKGLVLGETSDDDDDNDEEEKDAGARQRSKPSEKTTMRARFCVAAEAFDLFVVRALSWFRVKLATAVPTALRTNCAS